MPTYDYRCETTGEVFEVRHPMALKISTWSDLCDIGGFDTGTTPADAPVTKLLNTGGVISNKTLKNPEAPPCMSGGGCPGRCGI
ncbi:zinc ribbon domain-containing protein [uncultured Amphritea sp.]|uniref:zinc ribbon domain-containing protein n=1 Tax=Amphritea sp. TaxID=1872502 RepID=UPI0025EC1FEB|nr:zinc ribbon domain-containing protein [uncultured Amphritea sp.]